MVGFFTYRLHVDKIFVITIFETKTVDELSVGGVDIIFAANEEMVNHVSDYSKQPRKGYKTSHQ